MNSGLVFLHGMLAALAADGKVFEPTLLANAHPTYYGMLVAEFVRQGRRTPVAPQ